jgi:hypothetical protein
MNPMCYGAPCMRYRNSNKIVLDKTAIVFMFFTRVSTYVQRGSKFCFVLLVLFLLVGVIDIA